MTRFDRILSSVNTAGCGLEIGPSFAPAAPKSKGFNVEILDCLSAEDLKIKYANMPIENIEPVDYVWSGEPIDKLINKPNHYDYIIASHVIEHLPDMLSWLQQCSNLSSVPKTLPFRGGMKGTKYFKFFEKCNFFLTFDTIYNIFF